MCAPDMMMVTAKNSTMRDVTRRRAQHDMMKQSEPPVSFHRIPHISPIGGPAGRIAQRVSQTLSS